MPENKEIQQKLTIEGAREHNLKNVSLTIPRNTLTVITGLSGSGKSSLVCRRATPLSRNFFGLRPTVSWNYGTT